MFLLIIALQRIIQITCRLQRGTYLSRALQRTHGRRPAKSPLKSQIQFSYLSPQHDKTIQYIWINGNYMTTLPSTHKSQRRNPSSALFTWMMMMTQTLTSLTLFSLPSKGILIFSILLLFRWVSMNHCNYLKMPEIQVAVRQFKALSSRTHAQLPTQSKGQLKWLSSRVLLYSERNQLHTV